MRPVHHRLRLPAAPQSCGPASPCLGSSSLPGGLPPRPPRLYSASPAPPPPGLGRTRCVTSRPRPGPGVDPRPRPGRPRCWCAGRGNAGNCCRPRPFAETRPENPQRRALKPHVSQRCSRGGTGSSPCNLSVPESRELQKTKPKATSVTPLPHPSSLPFSFFFSLPPALPDMVKSLYSLPTRMTYTTDTYSCGKQLVSKD